MTTVAEKVEALRIQGIDQSLALAMAADAQRREKNEQIERQMASRSLVDRAREIAGLPPVKE